MHLPQVHVGLSAAGEGREVADLRVLTVEVGGGLAAGVAPVPPRPPSCIRRHPMSRDPEDVCLYKLQSVT